MNFGEVKYEIIKITILKLYWNVLKYLDLKTIQQWAETCNVIFLYIIFVLLIY